MIRKRLVLQITNQKKIISYFHDKGLFEKEFKCGQFMKMEYNKQYIDNYCYRCQLKVISPIHNIKENIRNNSIFSEIKIPIKVIYNLLVNCFLKNI